MRKVFLSLATVMLLSTVPLQAETEQSVVINGDSVEQTVTRMTFDGDNVVLTFDDNTTTTADMGTVSITFTTATGISPLSGYVLKAPVDGMLDRSNLPHGQEVMIYDANGKQLLRTNRHQIDVKSMKAGVYLLKTGSQIVKFIKR